jgi:hypothetical protein
MLIYTLSSWQRSPFVHVAVLHSGMKVLLPHIFLEDFMVVASFRSSSV